MFEHTSQTHILYAWVGQLDIIISDEPEEPTGLCGAATRNESFVVTAAHCFLNKTWDELYPNLRVQVKAGMIDRGVCNETYKQVVYVCLTLLISIDVHKL